MLTKILKNKYTNYLARCKVRLNGPDPWDIQVHNERLFQRVLLHGSLGFGEAYMDGWWDCRQLDELFRRLIAARSGTQLKFNVSRLWLCFKAMLFNMQKVSRALQVGEKHYNVGNDLFTRMLDEYMNYSCAYWRDADNLNAAQRAKMDLVCKKLKLEKGMKILDIGCGWGGMAKFAAQNYGVSVTGITISTEQANFAREFCKGLPIEILLQDYRSLQGHYDRAYSIGMFEHIGKKNYRIYMEKIRELLEPDSLFMLQTIGGNTPAHITDPWIEKHIFPNSMLPSCSQISNAVEGVHVMEDWNNFSTDYAKTLMAWHKNFVDSWDEIKSRYDQRFYRMWEYYLMVCAGAFEARSNQLWQIVLSPDGRRGGYRHPTRV